MKSEQSCQAKVKCIRDHLLNIIDTLKNVNKRQIRHLKDELMQMKQFV